MLRLLRFGDLCSWTLERTKHLQLKDMNTEGVWNKQEGIRNSAAVLQPGFTFSRFQEWPNNGPTKAHLAEANLHCFALCFNNVEKINIKLSVLTTSWKTVIRTLVLHQCGLILLATGLLIILISNKSGLKNQPAKASISPRRIQVTLLFFLWWRLLY